MRGRLFYSLAEKLQVLRLLVHGHLDPVVPVDLSVWIKIWVVQSIIHSVQHHMLRKILFCSFLVKESVTERNKLSKCHNCPKSKHFDSKLFCRKGFFRINVPNTWTAPPPPPRLSRLTASNFQIASRREAWRRGSWRKRRRRRMKIRWRWKMGQGRGSSP